MIERDWFKCVSAFNHVRNRTPNSNSALHDGRTPYELWHDESIPLRAQIDHLRVLGSLCYVVLPPELVPAGAKKAFKGVMLGYADESEIGQKAYIVRRLDDGKIVTATYAQTYTYENKFPYKRERDDVVEINGEERKYANDPDNGKYLDEEMSSSDSAESIDSQDELVAGLKPSAAEALDPARVEKAEDASWVSQSIDEIDVSESEHYGKGHARLVERGSLDTTSQIGEGNVMEDVDDMVRDLEINARAQPTHKYKLRQRPKGRGKHELEEKLEDRGPREPAGKYGGEASDSASHPSSRKSRTPRYVVGYVVDVARMGKKRNGDLVFRVVWENGQKTWEKKEMLLGGASRALHDFLLVLSRKQVARLRHGELEKLMKECERASEDEESSSDDDEPVYSRKAKERRQKRMQERHSVLKSMVKKKPKIALGETVPSTVKQAKAHSKWSEFAKDMKIEFDNFNKKNVWRLVPKPMNANVVSVRWVYDIKVKNGAVVRYKARLVCRGFNQKEGEDYDPAQLYAPTMKTKTLRVLVALAAKYGWDMNQYDVSCAFLHADLNEVVYVEQPLEHVIAGKENHVYVLDKAMYGLKQAPRAFATHLASCFKTLEFKQSDADECLWILRKPNGVVVYALYHVDDIIMVSNDNVARNNVFDKLCCVLDIRDEGCVDVFLNMKFEYGGDGSISLSQAHYIEKMAERFGVVDNNVKTPGAPDDVISKHDLPKSDEEQKLAAKLPYPALVGSLIYAVLTRPDVAYAVSNVAMYMSKWGARHYDHALRILKYLYTTRNDKLTYRKWNGDVVVVLYVDANYRDERDSGNGDKWCSQGGFLVFVGDCLVAWSSKRHRCRTLSSMEAEYVEAARAGQEVVWFRRLLGDLGHAQDAPTVMWEDNKAAIAFSRNQTCHDRSKHIDIRAYWLRDLVLEGSILMLHIATVDQLADFLTKHLRGPANIKAKNLVLGGWPFERNKGEKANVIVELLESFEGKHTAKTYYTHMMMGDIECY